MTCLAVRKNLITVAKGLLVDYYDYSNHNVIVVPQKSELEGDDANDAITDIVVSADCKYLALLTSTSKQLVVYNLPLSEKYRSYVLPRSASKIRFTSSGDQILVADKSGDVLIYSIKTDDAGTKLLGHLSLLLDVLQTNDGKYVITSDRDEKIKVSCYPNTYNIRTYCLGHKEFVNHMEILPHNDKYLTSTSGDGHVKCWDFETGRLCYSIDTFIDVNDVRLKEDFTKAMDSEGVEVENLPVVQYTIAQLSETSSILAIVVHTFNKLLLYSLHTVNSEFTHKLIDKLTMNTFPAAIQFHNLSLYMYDDDDCKISVFETLNENGNVSIKFIKEILMFENKSFSDVKANNHNSIKVLYKRKFDNVQEYQERKKQRLEKIAEK